MPELIGEHWEGDVHVRWYADGDQVTVEHWQDPQAAVDLVDTINAEGAETIDGLGKPVVEVPLTVAMHWCNMRGIPWEKFLYGNDYDAEFKRFAQDHSRLAYSARKSVHAVQ